MKASPSTPSKESNGFAFVTMLAGELSKGKVDLPSFPDVAQRVRKALQDEEVTADKIVRIVGAEPSLAARLIQLAALQQLDGLRSEVARFNGKVPW